MSARIFLLLACLHLNCILSFGQWTASNSGGTTNAPADYSGSDSGGSGSLTWARNWSFDFDGSLSASTSVTNVKATVNFVVAEAWGSVSSSAAGTYTKIFSETPSVSAFSDFIWVGVPGGAGAVGINHAVTNSGAIEAYALVRGPTGTSALAWPATTIKFEGQTWVTCCGSPNPAGTRIERALITADSYAYQSNGGSPELFPDVFGDATFSNLVESTASGSVYHESRAESDYLIESGVNYNTSPSLTSIHALAYAGVFVSVDSEVTVSTGSALAEAYSRSEGTLFGTTEVYLVY